jgi:hypothetical protein
VLTSIEASSLVEAIMNGASKAVVAEDEGEVSQSMPEESSIDDHSPSMVK